jgi:hypothetical protein
MAILSLSADVLLDIVRAEFDQAPDPRAENASLVLADALNRQGVSIAEGRYLQ